MDKSQQPLVSWAGGKSKLIPEIAKLLPKDIKSYDTYIEPFIGGGALLFKKLISYPFKQKVIGDINEPLINIYKEVKANREEVLTLTKEIQKELKVMNDVEKKAYYYKLRETWNECKDLTNTERAALMLYLTRNSFCGLWRINTKGKMDIAFGRASENMDLRNVIVKYSNHLKKIDIYTGDYKQSKQYIKGKTLIYFDPPYRPISDTSKHNRYVKEEFTDKEQTELALYCKELDTLGVKWILSNSDPKNTNKEDNFFDDLYKDFKIKRIKVKRLLGDKEARGKVTELLITNV